MQLISMLVRRPSRMSVLIPAVFASAVALAASKAPAPAPLDAVECRVRIARVLYEARSWPVGNPGSKPPFPERAARERAALDWSRDRLIASLLRDEYGIPLGRSVVQAEVNRIFRQTQDAATLQKMTSALDHSPRAFAECVARPMLAERLLRNAFAYDRSANADSYRLARNAAAAGRLPAEGAARSRYRLEESPGERPESGDAGATSRPLSAAEFGALQALYAGRTGDLRWEDRAREIVISRVAAQSSGVLEIDSVAFRKRSFDAWLAERGRTSAAGGDASAEPAPQPGSPAEYEFPARPATAPGAGCDEWGPPLDQTPDGRTDHVMVWTGSQMIVWGGSGYNSLGDGGIYDPATDSWTWIPASAASPSPRRGHSGVWTGSELLIWGGVSSPGQFNDGALYNPLTKAWRPMSGIGAPAFREGPVSVWTGTQFIVWGGTLTDGALYNPATDSWQPVAANNAARISTTGGTAVWSGTYMILWGTNDQTGGARYKPSTNQWLAVNNTGAPVSRYLFTALWNGSRMLVWGGRTTTTSTYLNTGASYNPTLNTWQAIPVDANTPSPRGVHTAVWSGTEMIVWGGQIPDLSYAYDGGRFSVATGSWTRIPPGTPNYPAPRYAHSAVWTGNEMLIWGGYCSSGTGCEPPNVGLLYNPATGAWRRSGASAGNPGGRSEPAGVWTGAELLVWGGRSRNTTEADGGIYTPATASWTYIPEDPGMQDRYQHTAVWTGAEMLVWGGLHADSESYSVVTTAGGFDPISRSWNPIDQSGAPSPRSSHVALWAGAEMAVWGGKNGAYGYNDGGLYDPARKSWREIPPADPGTKKVTAIVLHQNILYVWGGGQRTGWSYDLKHETWSDMPEPAAELPIPYNSNRTPIDIGGSFYTWGSIELPDSTRGARYDYETSAWSVLASAPAIPPTISSYQTVWTGREILFYGLTDVQGYRYIPLLDRWAVTSRANAPNPRSGHLMLAAGQGMYVWGGDVGYAKNSGAYYSDAAVLNANLQLTVQKGAGAVAVSWSPDPAAEFYELTTCAGDDPQCRRAAPEATLATSQTNPDDGQSHFFKVDGVSLCGF